MGSITYRTTYFLKSVRFFDVKWKRLSAGLHGLCEPSLQYIIDDRGMVFSGVKWGCSSVGRAVALQAKGQEFKSPQLHQFQLLLLMGV